MADKPKVKRNFWGEKIEEEDDQPQQVKRNFWGEKVEEEPEGQEQKKKSFWDF